MSTIPWAFPLGTMVSGLDAAAGLACPPLPCPVPCPRPRGHAPVSAGFRARPRPHGHGAGPRRGSLVERQMAEGRPVVDPAEDRSPGYRVLKRGLDIAGALALLVALGPLMLAVYLVLLVTTRGRPIFWQPRAGYLGCPFRMAKFRTMRPDAERLKAAVANEACGPVFKNRRDPRITALGRFLRKTSLDETPQLFHVLFGQMSLVGPRPLDVREVVRFAAWQRGRLAVLPGLTCLWQVSGRSDVSFEHWIRMDLRYVRSRGLWTDCKLLLRTPWSVLSCRGAY